MKNEWLTGEILSLYCGRHGKYVEAEIFFPEKQRESSRSTEVYKSQREKALGGAWDRLMTCARVGGNHWVYLVAFRGLQQRVQLYDSGSLFGSHAEAQQRVEAMAECLAEFTGTRWEAEVRPGVPQQENADDCGVFCTMFAEFATTPDAALPFSQKDARAQRKKIAQELTGAEVDEARFLS